MASLSYLVAVLVRHGYAFTSNLTKPFMSLFVLQTIEFSEAEHTFIKRFAIAHSRRGHLPTT